MARATRRKNKVQNSQNESVKAAEETEPTTASDRPRRNAKLNNKSWQDLIPKARKSAGSTNNEEREVGVEEEECDENEEEDLADRIKKNRNRTARLNNKSWQELIPKPRKSVVSGGKEGKEKVEDNHNEEDMADRIKKNRRSVVKDLSSTDVKSVKQINKSKKGAKRTEIKQASLSVQDNVSDMEDSVELQDKDLSKPDDVIEVIKPSTKPSRKRAIKQNFEAATDQVAEVIKPSRKKVSKKSFEVAVNEIVDDAKRSRKGQQERSEKAPKVVNHSSIENPEGEKRNSKIRQTRSANNSNMDDQGKKPKHSKSKLEEAKYLNSDKKEYNNEVKVSDRKEDNLVVRTSSRRSSSRIEMVQLEETKKKAKNNAEENKGEKENEDIFTKVITKKPSVKQSKVLLKPPPKQYKSKPNDKQKLPPKKSLASKDILNLLSDDDDDNEVDELDEAEKHSEKGTALKDKTNTLPARTKRLAQSTIMEAFAKTPQISATKMNSPRKSINRIFTSRDSPNPSETLASKKVPVWKKVANDSTSVSKIDKPVHDVFNMDCYGEEEFGPEDVKAKKKKRAPRKKGTKGILVFGGNTKKQVKQICNLKTPGDQNKRKKRIVNIVDPQNLPPATEISSATNTENTQIPNTRNMKPPADNPERAARLEVPKPTYQNKNTDASFIRPQTSLIVDNTPIGLPQPRRIEMDSHLSTDFSTGAHAYFDSNAGNEDDQDDHHHADDDYFEGPPPPEDLPDQPMSDRSGLFGQSVVESHKSYKTPAVPRHMTKLQTKNASTPRMEDRVQPVEPVTVKEQIKNAFGFDDSTDEDETDGERSFAISPVRKVADPVLAMLNSPSNSICGASSRLSTMPSSRLSTFSTSSRLSMVPKGGFLTSSINAGRKIEERKDGPFRFTMGPSNNALLAARLVAQAKKMPPKFSKPLPKSSSSLKQLKSSSSVKQIYPSSNLKQTKIPDSINQQASNNLKVPAVSYGNINDKDKDGTEEVVNKAPDNASDKSAKQKVKKMVKKAPKNKPPDPDQSSVLEEVKPVRSKPLRNAAKEANERLEEISKSPEKEMSPNTENSPVKRSRPVAKTYVRRNNTSKPAVSFDESIPHSPPKKLKIREAKVNQWAALQTSHFSEVDDFDLSFA